MIGLGCMRLSTEPSRDDARSLEVIAAALDGGVALLDTADVYARDDTEIGHNESLIARAIAGRSVEIVTKGGLAREGQAWIPSGRAKHLDAAARASKERLGAIDLYLLHAIDPRVPLATSVRALARLRDVGIVRAIGLSNVGVHQLEQALALAPIAAVEVELSPYKLDAMRGGLVRACSERGIRVLAHRPLGGPAGVKRLARDKLLRELATTLDVTPAELALGWLQAHGTIPLPGATRVETARSVARAGSLVLPAEIVRALDDHILELGRAAVAVSEVEREIVLIAGMPAAGKSTLAADYEARGYVRLNRDDRGGSLIDLAKALDRELSAGAAKVVLDNTYGTRASRQPVIAIGTRHGVPVRCVVANTSFDDAQANAILRMLDLHGRVLMPDELRAAKMIAPNAQFTYRRTYEPPRTDEGFASVDEVPFARTPATGTQRALVVDLDTNVWRARANAPGDQRLVDGARDRFAAFHAAGYVLAGTTWLTSPALDAWLVDALGLPIEILRCSHPAGPPICWCRKPLPGLVLQLARTHAIDLSRSIYAGTQPIDRTHARRAGMQFADLTAGWPAP